LNAIDLRGNLNRHLARLVWPQSALLSSMGFFEEQVYAYCAARWPQTIEEQQTARAQFLCLAYGAPVGSPHTTDS